MIFKSFTRRLSNLVNPRTALAMIGLGLLSVTALSLSTPPAQATAGINQTINYQGRLLNAAGAVIADGNYNMEFKIYQDGPGNVANDTGGTLKWTEDWLGVNSQAVTVKNGYFSVNLGTINNFAAQVDWNQNTLWLSQTVVFGANATSTSCANFTACNSTSEPELLPMKRLASAVYALNSNLLGGLTSSQFVQLAQGIQTASVSTNPAIGINATSGAGNMMTLQSSGTDVFDVTSTGNLQFGGNADKTVNVAAPSTNIAGRALVLQAGTGGSGAASAAGGLLTLQGGNANSGTGSANGGDVRIYGGSLGGAGAVGNVTLAWNGTSQVGFVGIGKAANASYSLDVNGNVNTSGTVSFTGVANDISTPAGEDLTLALGTTGKLVVGGTTPTVTSAGALTVSTGANGALNLSPNGSGDVVVSQGAGSNVQLTASAPTTLDQLVVSNSGQASVTTGVDGLQVTFGSSNASGDALHVTPSYAGGATDGLTYNALEVDAFSPTNAAGTDTVNGLQLGALTDPGGTITSRAINVGAGWDNVLTVGGTPIINGSGVTQVAGGGTGQTTIQAAINSLSGLTTEGDLLFRNATDATRLARGSNGQCLTSSTTTILWGACGSGGLTQTPTTNSGAGSNNVQPATSGIVAMTLNGTTTGTAAQALIVNQTVGGANAMDINVSNPVATTVANALAVTQSNSGTLTNGISFSGTITNDIFRATGTLSLQGGTGASGVAGAAISAIAGNGGGTVSTTAGAGGALTETTGTGGAATGSGTGGAGGNYTLTAGSGGTSSTGNGGNGGTLFLQPGAGGVGGALNGTDGRVQIGSSTTNAVGNVLTLDSYNAATEAAFGAGQNINGSMYYNTNTNKFRCYQSSAWADCIAAGGTVRLDQIQAANTTATIANAANAINWNWQFSAAGTGLSIGETAASTGGSNNQYLLSAVTASGSTAAPLRVTNAGTANTLFTNSSSGSMVYNLSGTGDFIIQDAGTAFLTIDDTGGMAMTLDATDNPSIVITNAGTGSFTYNMSTAGNGSFLVQNAGTNTIQVNGGGDVFLGKQDFGRFVTIGTGVSGNKTPTLLMLDQRGVATDPSFFEGGMYYNAFNQKFRCGQGAAWIDCIGSGGSGLAKNAQDTSSFAVPATGTPYLYAFTNSSSAIVSGVLQLDNGSNTGTALRVTSTAGNLLDLQNNVTSKLTVASTGATTITGSAGVGVGSAATVLTVTGGAGGGGVSAGDGGGVSMTLGNGGGATGGANNGGNGGSFTLTAGTGGSSTGGTGGAGGNVTINVGKASGLGATGSFIVKPQTAGDAAGIVKFQNAAGANVLSVDTNTPSLNLGVAGSLTGQLKLGNATGANSFILQPGVSAAAETWVTPVTFPSAGNCLTAGSVAAPVVNLAWASCGGGGGLAKNAMDTSSFAVTAAGYLYAFTNSSSAVASGVLSLDNGSNTGLALNVTGTETGTTLAKISDTSLTSGTILGLQGGTSAMTTGTVLELLSASYNHSAGNETGSLQKLSVTDATSLATASAATTTNGAFVISTINVTGTGTGTKTTNAFNAGAPNLTGCSATNTCVWNGLLANNTASGITNLTQNGVSVAATGVSAGTLNALNIGSITGSTGRENAINFGTGWDSNLTIVASSAGATANSLTVKNNAATQKTLLEVRDLTANTGQFGSLVVADAFVGKQSYFGEEYNSISGGCFNTSFTAFTNNLSRGTMATGNTFGTDCAANGNDNGTTELSTSSIASVSGVSNGCSYQSPATNTNGLENVKASTGASGTVACLEYNGTSSNNVANTIFNTGNLPQVVMKVRPSTGVGTTGRVFVGLSTLATAATNPGVGTKGIYFTNCSAPTTPTCGTNWIGAVQDGTNAANVTASCGAISTTNFAYLRIEVRKSTSGTSIEVQFFIDTDVSDGIVETSCGSITTTTTAMGNTAMSMLYMVAETGASVSTYSVDMDYFRVWQDDAPSSGSELQGSAKMSENDQALAGATVPTYDPVGQGDMSENFPVADRRLFGSGDVVSIDEGGGGRARKSRGVYDGNLVGVISSSPGVTLGRSDDSTVRVAVGGRVPVRASLENGVIEPGDMLTSSSQAGVAMKATKAGPVIGRALEAFDGLHGDMVLVQLEVTGHKPQVDAGDLQSGRIDQALIGTLTVDKGLEVLGNANFRGLVAVNDLEIAGHVTVSHDTAGTAMIPAGQASVKVVFDKPYAAVPVVTTGVSDFVTVRVTDKTVSGFTVGTQQPVAHDTPVDWTALEPKQPKTP